MVHGKNRISYRIDRRLSGLAGPYYNATISFGLPYEPEDSQYGKSRLEGVGYRFVHLDLGAVHVMNLYGRYVVLLSGVVETRRTLGLVESQIPNDIGSALEAAAWVSYALESYRSQLEPLPDWFVEGERHWDLVPPARVGLAARERQLAYEASPKCFVDRDYARPLRRNLLEEISWLDGETEMTCSFDGRVLRIVLCGRVHEVVARGDSWPSSYQVIVFPETTLPPRFTSSTVVFSVFEGYVCVDGLRLGPCESVARPG